MSLRRIPFSATLVAAGFGLLLVLAGPGVRSTLADISASDVQVTTPVYRPSFSSFDPKLGRYTYKVSWQGIPAATVTLDVERTGLKYEVGADVSVYRAIRLLYNLRYKAKATISAIDLTPQESTYDHKENSKEKFTRLTFLPSGEIKTEQKRKGRGTTVTQFNPNNFTLDPFSAAFLARSLEWREGETKRFDTYNGRSRYLIELTAVKKINMAVNGKPRDVWIISPKVNKLTSSKAKKKLRGAQIYITADKDREILAIKSEVFIGSVKTRLESFTPSKRALPPTSVAAGKKNFSF